MKRRLLGAVATAAVAGTALAAVAANRRLSVAGGPLAAPFDGTRRTWRWRGYDIVATEAGSGPLVLLVHGIYAGSSSYEFRKLFPLLARHRRVVAFDLLGCGRSARPNITYSADLFVDQIVDAVAHFGPNVEAIVGSSLGGAFCIRAAARAGARVGSLAVICPTGLAGALDRPATRAGRAVTALLRSAPLGEALFNLLVSRASLGWFLRNQAYAEPSSVTPEIVDDYWAAAHQPGARFVAAHFVGGALNCNVEDDLPRVEGPVLIAWGERAYGPSPIGSAAAYVGLARNGTLATFARSRLLPHEEEAHEFAVRLDRFLSASAE